MPYVTLPRFVVANKLDKIPTDDDEEEMTGNGLNDSSAACYSAATAPGRRFVARHELDGFYALSATSNTMKNDDALFERLLSDVARAAVDRKRKERGGGGGETPSPTDSSVGSFHSNVSLDDSPSLFGRRIQNQSKSNYINNLSGSTTSSERKVETKKERERCC